MEKVKKRVGLAEREPVNAGEREGAESVPSQEKGSNLFKPGQPPGPGRPKGVPNKINRSIREAILAATQPGQCHEEGLQGWLVEQARGGIESKKIFAALVGRALPIEVTGTDGGPIKIDLGWLGQRRIGYGDVVDVLPVTPTTQTPANPLLAGGATDVISVHTDSEGGEP